MPAVTMPTAQKGSENSTITRYAALPDFISGYCRRKAPRAVSTEALRRRADRCCGTVMLSAEIGKIRKEIESSSRFPCVFVVKFSSLCLGGEGRSTDSRCGVIGRIRRLRLFRFPSQLSQIQLDRLIGTHQIGKYLFPGSTGTFFTTIILQKGPEPFPDRAGKDALQILQSRPSQIHVIGVQTSKSNFQRLRRPLRRWQLRLTSDFYFEPIKQPVINQLSMFSWDAQGSLPPPYDSDHSGRTQDSSDVLA